MNLPPLQIIIPSHDRDGLLERTLTSLAACALPAELRRVVVAENGAKLGAEALVARFQDRLPIQYRYTDLANKSRALNEALADLTDEFVIFYDDDVRIDPGNPAAYLRAAAGRTGGVFFGGRCSVDYVERPPDWLLPRLPASARGWSLGDQPCPLELPRALGFNWAAFAADLKAAGGFNEARGPGRWARGQESEMQERLFAAGVKGVYLPDALVWHYVPPERCSPEWALARTLPMAAQLGIVLAGRPALERWWQTTLCRTKIGAHSLLLALLGSRFSAPAKFRHLQGREYHRGILEGLRRARS